MGANINTNDEMEHGQQLQTASVKNGPIQCFPEIDLWWPATTSALAGAYGFSFTTGKTALQCRAVSPALIHCFFPPPHIGN